MGGGFTVHWLLTRDAPPTLRCRGGYFLNLLPAVFTPAGGWRQRRGGLVRRRRGLAGLPGPPQIALPKDPPDKGVIFMKVQRELTRAREDVRGDDTRALLKPKASARSLVPPDW